MKYSRILLKLSGEALMGNESHGISKMVLTEYVSQIREVADAGCEVAIVIGGGNIFRGVSGTLSGFDRVKGQGGRCTEKENYLHPRRGNRESFLHHRHRRCSESC